MGLPLLRLSACLITVAVSSSLGYVAFVSVVFAFAVSHILLAVPYSSGQLATLASDPRRFALPSCLLMALAAASMVYDQPPMFLVFGFHHVCNEAYFAQERFGRAGRGLVLARSLMHASVYAAIAREELVVLGLELPVAAYAGIVAAATGAYLLLLLRKRAEGAGAELAYELLAPLAAAIGLATKALTLDHVLTYHFLFWAAYPVKPLAAKGALLRYAAATLGLFGVALLFTPVTLHWGGLDEAGLSRVTRVLGYFHIFTSIALSRQHPAWLRTWFTKPAPPAASLPRAA